MAFVQPDVNSRMGLHALPGSIIITYLARTRYETQFFAAAPQLQLWQRACRLEAEDVQALGSARLPQGLALVCPTLLCDSAQEGGWQADA